MSALWFGAGCTPQDTGGTDGNEEPANRAPTIVVTTASGDVDPVSLPPITAGQTLMLSAGSSTDADGDTITLTWVVTDAGGTEVGTVSGADFSFLFAEAGTYTITLTVSDGRGLSTSNATRTLSITVAQALPVALFTATPNSGLAPLTVNFDASASSDADGTIDTYSWDFDDGSEDGSGVSVTHEFASGAIYDVTLTVTDDDGNSASVIRQVTVQTPLPPTLSAEASATTAEVNQVITFTATAADPEGGTLTYAWDFGDGATADTAVATHAFTTEGPYSVSITVTDDQDLTATATLEITITVANLAPIADVVATPLTGIAPLTVTLDASGSTDPDFDAATDFDGVEISAYCWDFGLGTADPCDNTMAIATAEYDAAGTYEVSLTVSEFLATQTLVSDPVTETISVLAVDAYSVSPLEVYLEPTGTQQLTVLADLSDGSTGVDITLDPNTTYESSDLTEAVITVDATGLITAVAVGTATIDVVRPAITTPVTVNVEVVAPISATASVTNIPVEGYFFYSGVDVTADLSVSAPTGGVGPFTFDWDVDVTQTNGSLVDDTSFTDETAQTPSIDLDAEGTYQITCNITDSTTLFTSTASVTVLVSSIDAAPVLAKETSGDGCILALPPQDVTPVGADGPSVLRDAAMGLLGNVTGGLGTVTFDWSADVGSFVDNTLEDPQWTVPEVEAAGSVTFTLVVSDDFVSIPFTYLEEISPPPLVSQVCEGTTGDVDPCTPTPLTITLTGGGTAQLTMYHEVGTGSTGVIGRLFCEDQDGLACTGVVSNNCAGLAAFTDDMRTCDLTFDETGVYRFEIQLQDDCSKQSEATPLPTAETDLFITVDP